KADVSFNVDHRIRESQNNIGNETDASFYEAIVATPDWYPMYINGLPVNLNGRDNLLAILNSGYSDARKSQGYSINASLTYEPTFLKGLQAKFQISQRGGNGTSNQYRPPYRLYDFAPMGNNGSLYSTNLLDTESWGVEQRNSYLNTNLNRDNGYQGFVTLSYNGSFDKHNIGVVVGGEQTVSNSEVLGVRWDNQLIPDYEDYWAFDQNLMQLDGRSIFETTKRSAFGRLSYDFDSKCMLQVVTRLDASSNFARGNRWGWSPSIGAGWVVSEEDFFKENVSFVNHLKLKVNYGITGDDRVLERLWQERYTLDINNGYMFGDDQYGIGLNPSVYPNLNITWEKRRTFNFGIESSMLNNQLSLGIEFFQNKTYDGFDQGASE